MENSLENEVVIHGSRWHTVHGGYFADPRVALPFLDVITHEISQIKPRVVADLGGGTGFILSELAKRFPKDSIKYINVDISPGQLNECKYDGVSPSEISATDITRNLLVKDRGPLMIIMRSLLHYLGDRGALPFLRHLRAQLNPGETMIHQTACFELEEDAACANDLYSLMRTGKWYPTVAALTQTLAETGWRVACLKPAPDLCLNSSELAERYGLNAEDITKIINEIGVKYRRPPVFIPEGSSTFTAYLHYRIFVCRAK